MITFLIIASGALIFFTAMVFVEKIFEILEDLNDLERSLDKDIEDNKDIQ